MDVTGVFGPPGTNLTGDSYKATYAFDTTQGYAYASPTLNYNIGGPGIFPHGPYNSPVISASVTISGKTVPIDGSYWGDIRGYNNGYQSLQSHYAEGKAILETSSITANYRTKFQTWVPAQHFLQLLPVR
jgi:hypothetical protein